MASVEEMSNAVPHAVEELNTNCDTVEEEVSMDLDEPLNCGYVFYR